jgi:NodT family efflux transporter outer membrane factor (OMF) lipoprotein
MKKLLPACLLLSLCGCVIVGEDGEIPEAPTAENLFNTEQGLEADNLANWWRQFQDPVLSNLIEQGLASAPTLDAALARLRAARAEREGTEASFYPQFTADGSYRWGRSWGAGETSGWNRNLTASVDAAWELDVFGGLARATERSGAQEAKLAYTLQDVRVSLAAEIASTYVAVRRYEGQVTIAEANLALQERSVELVKKRHTSGDVIRYDVVTAEAQAARTRAALPQHRQNLNDAALRLDWLTGNPPYTFKAYLKETQDVMHLPEVAPKAPPAALLRRRADVRMAETEILAQTAAIGVAEAELYPKFAISGSIGISSPDLTPWGSYTRQISFGPSVRWNLFGFGYWQRKVDAAEASLEATIADYRNTVLEAYRETEAAWIAYHREIERTPPLLDAERFCREALSIAERRYEFGDIAIDDVITQQALLLSAQENLVAHRAQLFDNAITLYRALGGGWSDETDNEVGAYEALLPQEETP